MKSRSERFGAESVPVYSPDGPLYRDRLHRNGRAADQAFDPEEHLFRRYPKNFLIDGRPVPLSMQFEDDEGISVNRGKYSEPQDVLEPDCCDGHQRAECVVLDIRVSEVPAEIATTDGTNRLFRFRMNHRPKEQCYAHSEIWCNEQGDIDQPHQQPPKHVKNLFRGELARHLAKRDVLEFVAPR